MFAVVMGECHHLYQHLQNNKRSSNQEAKNYSAIPLRSTKTSISLSCATWNAHGPSILKAFERIRRLTQKPIAGLPTHYSPHSFRASGDRHHEFSKWNSSNIFACVDPEWNYRRLFFIGHCVFDVDKHFEGRPGELRNIMSKNNVDHSCTETYARSRR